MRRLQHGVYGNILRDDLIVLTSSPSATRPPIDDFDQGGEKDWRRIERSDDDLEKAIFNELRQYFDFISRYSTVLSKAGSSLPPKDSTHLATINFSVKGNATIASMEIDRGGRPHKLGAPKDFNSVGFFLHLPKITGYPCGAIVSFSMGGYENLLWNRIVRLRYQDWLKRPVFAFALLNLPAEPLQPLTPMLADTAPTKILIQHWLDKAPADR